MLQLIELEYFDGKSPPEIFPLKQFYIHAGWQVSFDGTENEEPKQSTY
jgi:hypothetical protein